MKKIFVLSFALILMLLVLVSCNGKGGEEDVHSWGAWYTEREATCKVEGMRKRYCAECNEFESEIIPVTNDHIWGTAR